MNQHVSTTIAQLINKGIKHALITERDEIYLRNQILGLLQLDEYHASHIDAVDTSIPDLLDALVLFAVETKVIADVLDEKEILSAKIMDCFLSKPTEINATFHQKYKESPGAATDYFYQLSKNSNYIQMNRIAKNIHYKTQTPYGDLDITINLSKPEKDPEQLKRERAMKQAASYPNCVLCAENEGYVGRTGHPARSNHRIIDITLEGEQWFLQYSPYVYYNEHSILFASEHRPMKINRASFERLTAFVEKFPHYFMGSNADIPIVGGSILNHDHYQGGRYTFAMTKAEEEFSFDLARFPSVQSVVVKWPMSVIRLRSPKKEDLLDAAEDILNTWKQYSDPSVEIEAFTKETPHNTITPIARIRDNQFELDLVLRNNRTSELHPFGIFHPHEDVHHIKKENIGLIEVMGLAVLPPRLKSEIDQIKDYLLDGKTEVAPYHLTWAKEMKDANPNLVASNVEEIVYNALGEKFTRVLEDSGVFKSNNVGREAFRRFLKTLNR